MKTFSEQEIRILSERREKNLVRSLAGQKLHAQLFEPYGITLTEFRILSFLMWNPGGAEPSVIADSLLVLRQTMTKIIDSLEKRCLATRTEHPTDRRSIYIRLLPAGVELIRTLLEIETEYMLSVEKHFTKEELEAYQDLSWRMQEAKDFELLRILNARSKS